MNWFASRKMGDPQSKRIEDGAAWASRLGWDASRYAAWEIVVTMGTRPIYDWVSRRNKLQPDDMLLSLSVRSFTPWVAHLKRHDGLFSIDWRPGLTSVDTEQLRYRRLTPWPAMSEPGDFPALVGALNRLPFRPILAAAQVQIPSPGEATRQAMYDWLSGVCDTVEFIGDADGPQVYPKR